LEQPLFYQGPFRNYNQDWKSKKQRKMELIALSVIGGITFIAVGIVVFSHKRGTLK
jgi:hypothetical protein